jgi:hypothetical protein
MSSDQTVYNQQILTRAEEEDHYQAVIKGGTRWGLTGVTAGVTGALVANRYWSGFRGLTVHESCFVLLDISFIMGLIFLSLLLWRLIAATESFCSHINRNIFFDNRSG